LFAGGLLGLADEQQSAGPPRPRLDAVDEIKFVNSKVRFLYQLPGLKLFVLYNCPSADRHSQASRHYFELLHLSGVSDNFAGCIFTLKIWSATVA
jgi:hypothetical protein